MSISIDKKGIIFIVCVVIIIVLLCSLFVDIDLPAYPTGPEDKTAKGYYIINATYTHHLLNTISNITVVDCSPTKDSYKIGDRLPKSTWTLNPSLFYDYETPIIVYSTPDANAKQFCIDLVESRRYFGIIYFMQGGYQGWLDRT